MSRSPRWSLRAVFAVVAIVFAACSGATPSVSPSGTTAPPTTPASQEPFDGSAYPEDGSSACDVEGYGGTMGSIRAVDADTVEFKLCKPDVAFLSKIAFASLGIQDADYLESTGGGGEALFRNPNGTGPYKLKENGWTSGSEMVLEAFADYWGDAPLTPTAVFRWGGEAAQRLLELQSGTVDGIDNVGADDFGAVEGNADLKLFPRTALNVMYLGMNNTKELWKNEKVRQAIAMGIDRKRIVDTFFPPGSQVASHFTPCEIPGGCEGEEWYEFDPAAAKQLLADAGYPNGFKTKLHLRETVRCYFPTPPDIATDVQAQLKENLNIDAQIDIIDTNTYLGIASRGELEGMFFLGWCADFPDVTNFLDTFFGAGSDLSLGEKYADIIAELDAGSQSADQAVRDQHYTTANNLIKQHAPLVPISHGGSATAFRADVEGAHSSPLSNEALFAMKAGDRQQIVFMSNAEPAGVYCADETDGEALRPCEQMFEALYSYEIAGTAPLPGLAKACTPSEDLMTWTCDLQTGVKFHNGADFDANDVVMTYAVQWDAAHPLHVGREGLFEYWGYLFGPGLNPPPAPPA
jgi:peptide/nickel transport system substrate-binding protein